MWFPQEGRDGAGKAGLGLTSLNNFTGLWDPRPVPGCLVLGPRVIRAGGKWPRVWEPNAGDGWGVDSRLVGLHLKGVLLQELFIISRDWPVLPWSARPQVSKHQNRENKRHG